MKNEGFRFEHTVATKSHAPMESGFTKHAAFATNAGVTATSRRRALPLGLKS
jgi:hypothetical protein